MKLLELSSPSGLDCAQRTYRWNNPSIESHAKELVLLFQCFYLLIFGSHFLLQKHHSFNRRRHVHVSKNNGKEPTTTSKRPQSLRRDVLGKRQQFPREMDGWKSPQNCVNHDNSMSLTILKIHHPSASMHPEPVWMCHSPAEIVPSGPIFQQPFPRAAAGGSGFDQCDKIVRFHFQYLLFCILAKSVWHKPCGIKHN